MKLSVRTSIAVFGLLAVLFVIFHSTRSKQFFPREGSRHLSTQNLEEFLHKSEDRYAKNSNDLSALVDCGVAYYFLGPDYYEKALNAFNAAWRFGALDERIFYYSGILYEKISINSDVQKQLAQKEYERFLRHNPDDREVRLRLARLLFRIGKWDEAISNYQMFIEHDSKDVTAIINLGLAYQKKYEMKFAKVIPAKLTEEEKSEKDSLVNQALEELEAAKKLDPKLPEGVNFSIAKLYSEKNDWAHVAEYCQLELTVSPDQKETLQLLALAYEKMGQKDQALEIVQKLLIKDPQNRQLKQKAVFLKPPLKKTKSKNR